AVHSTATSRNFQTLVDLVGARTGFNPDDVIAKPLVVARTARTVVHTVSVAMAGYRRRCFCLLGGRRHCPIAEPNSPMGNDDRRFRRGRRGWNRDALRRTMGQR